MKKSPLGQGSGEQFVRESFPSEVKDIRWRKSIGQVGPWLIAVVDADTNTVTERLRELDRRLTESDQSRLSADDNVVILCPKRNIETWIYHVRGDTVDEETIYPKRGKPRDWRKAVRSFVDEIPDGDLAINAPDSLKAAIAEMQRIQKD